MKIKGETGKVIQKIEPSASPVKRRGRPKKSNNTESQDESTALALPKHRGRVKKETDSDTACQPTEPDQVEGDEVEEEDWEAGALAWGLVVAGGLGVGSAGVFGAENIAR